MILFSFWNRLLLLFVAGATFLSLSAATPQTEFATVAADDTPIYSRTSATGRVTAILQKGQIVSVQPETSVSLECWLRVAWYSNPERTGFIRCEDIQHSTSAANSAPTAGPAGKDQIDRLLSLAGIDRFVQRMTGQSRLRFLSNTRRLDENQAQVQDAYERALRFEAFYGPIRARLLPYSSSERIHWLGEQFNQPPVRKATELMLEASSLESGRQLVPYFTDVATIPASALRVRQVERIEKALDEPEVYVDVLVAFTRGAAMAPTDKCPKPEQLAQMINGVRARSIKEAARTMRIAYLYSFATLSDDELEQYARFVESDNVKWMYGMVRQGILAGSETFGKEVATSLAQLSKPASPSLASPAEGRSAQELYEQGIRLIDDGNEQEATRFLDAAIQLKPDYAIAYYKRGNAYRDLDQVSKAVDDYTQAIHFDSSMTSAYLNRGISLRYLGQPQRAVEDLTSGIESNPQMAAVWIERALTYSDLEQYTQAVADYTQAIRITPTDGEAWAWRGMSHGHAREWQRSWQDCEIGIRLGTRPSELAPVYTCTGRALSGMNDYNGAISELDRSIELDATSAITYGNRGWALEQTGRIEDALRDYDKGIELDPRDAWTHCQRAAVLEKLGRSHEGDADREYCSADPF